ncbi:hypothetical protein M91_08190 [Bos mutus]|uniref:NADH dehydrogenase [ubiquinone] 1 alpha subcomplex assembly factor 4 n=1 Tax=Bos mutus TaxID=72004 RepID=L8ISS1_9CETA|nr:hypothetical protein M91_08190 [Bos mutus]
MAAWRVLASALGRPRPTAQLPEPPPCDGAAFRRCSSVPLCSTAREDSGGPRPNSQGRSEEAARHLEPRVDRGGATRSRLRCWPAKLGLYCVSHSMTVWHLPLNTNKINLVPDPRHPSTKNLLREQMSSHPEIKGEIDRKDDKLLSLLKDVYVDSQDPMSSLQVKDAGTRQKPKEFRLPKDHQFDMMNVKNIPKAGFHGVGTQRSDVYPSRKGTSHAGASG